MSEYTLEIGAIAEADRRNWNSCVSHCEHGTFFHRYEWLKAIEKGLSLEPRHIIVRKGATIVGGLPQFIASVRGVPLRQLSSIPIGYGGPVLVGDRATVLGLILSNVRRSAGSRRLIYHHITTGDLDYAQYAAYLEDRGYVPDLRTCRFVLDLRKSLDDLSRSFSAGRRRQVKRLEEDTSFTLEDDSLEDGLDEFYPLYVETMARVGGWQRPRAFFEVLAELAGDDQVRLFRCKSGGQTIAALVHMIDRHRKVLHYFFGAASKAARETLASQALHFHSVRWGKEHGLLTYDLGQTKADPTDSLFIWKRTWGGQVEPCLAWRLPLSRSLAMMYVTARDWRRRLIRWLG